RLRERHVAGRDGDRHLGSGRLYLPLLPVGCVPRFDGAAVSFCGGVDDSPVAGREPEHVELRRTRPALRRRDLFSDADAPDLPESPLQVDDSHDATSKAWPMTFFEVCCAHRAASCTCRNASKTGSSMLIG